MVEAGAGTNRERGLIGLWKIISSRMKRSRWQAWPVRISN
jgi:hypothetical protein